MPIVVRHDVPPQLLADVALRAGMAQRRMQQQQEQEKMFAAMLQAQGQQEARALQEKIAAAKEAGDLEQQRRLYEKYLPGLEKAREAAQHPAPGTPEFENQVAMTVAEQVARQETPEQAGLKAGAIATAQDNAKLAAEQARHERDMKAIDDAEASGEIDHQMAEDARRRKLDAKLPPPRPPTMEQDVAQNTFRVGQALIGKRANGELYQIAVIPDTQGQIDAKERIAADKERAKLTAEFMKLYVAANPGADPLLAAQHAANAASIALGEGPLPTPSDIIGDLIGEGQMPEQRQEIPAGAPAPEVPMAGQATEGQFVVEEVGRDVRADPTAQVEELKALARRGNRTAQAALAQMGIPLE